MKTLHYDTQNTTNVYKRYGRNAYGLLLLLYVRNTVIGVRSGVFEGVKDDCSPLLP
jgi:hypothetical protein